MWLFLRPGITKPRPGKSGRRSGSRVLPTDLCDVGLELAAFRLGDSTCSKVARLVVAVDEAFAADVPAGAHPFFAPLRSVAGAIFPAKSRFQISPCFIKNSVIGSVFLVMRASSSSPLFLFISFVFPFFFVVPGPGGCDRRVFGIGFDEVGR